MRPLEEILADELPARIRPPGEVSAYSNHAVALAGHIVARLSGLTWEAYVEQHITQPLAMLRTSPYQPVPDPLAPDVAKGYVFRNGRLQERGFEYVPLAPAGSISATAVDMANFMIAHLQDGRFGDSRIALGAGYYGVLAWRESAWTLFGRIHYTLVVLGVFIFIWWLSYWNLLIQPLIG